MTALAALAFAVAVAFWPGLLSAAVAPRWSLIAVGLPLTSWLDPRRLTRGAQICVSIVIAYAAVSLLWTPDALSGENDLCRLVLFGLAVLAGANVENLSPVMRAMGWGVAISSVLVIPQSLGWSPVIEAAPPAGLFFNRDFLAEIAAVLFVWACFAKHGKLLAMVLAVPLAICGSRIALLCVAAGMIAGSTRYARRFVTAVFLAIVACFAVITIFYPYKVNTAIIRFGIWELTLRGTTIAGDGIGSYIATFPWEYAHSDLLQSFYELGIGGIALSTLFVLAVRAESSRAIRAAVVCMAVQYATAFPLHLPATAFLAGLLVGHVARVGDRVGVVGYVGGGGVGARA